MKIESIVAVALFANLATGTYAAAPVTTLGFLNTPRAEAPGTLLSHPATNDSITLGRTTTINYVNGWLIVGAEVPGSAPGSDYIKRIYDISDPAHPLRRYPTDFGLSLDQYTNNIWSEGNDGWNAHGSAQAGAYLVPSVMRVQSFGGPVERGGANGVPQLSEMALGYDRSSQAGPWQATMLWYGTPTQQMQIQRVSIGANGLAEFHPLATFDHVGSFGGGDWHPMFFGDLLIYARSGGAAHDGVVVYRLEYHDANDDGVLDSVTPHFVSSLPGGFQGYWPNLFSDGNGLYVIGSATDILTSADITAAASAEGGPVVAGPTLTIPGFSNASYPVYQDQFGFIHNRKINMTQFLAGQGMSSVVLTLDEVGTGVDTTQMSLALGNLWITGGYPNQPRHQGMAVWVHQQGPDTNAPTVAFHIPQANRQNYPRFAPLSFLLHEHPRHGGPRNGVDFTVRPVGLDGATLGAFVPGYLIHDFAGVLTFTPDTGLAADTTYQVDFLSDISDPENPVGFFDAAGNVIAPYSFRFSTGGGVDALPAPQFTNFTASDYQPLPGEECTVSATASGTGSLEYRFNFEDGWSEWAGHSTTNHAYAAAGRHRVLAQVRDDSGIAVTQPLNLLVLAPPVGPLPTQSSTLAVGDDGAAGRRVWVVNPDTHTVTVLNATNGAFVVEHTVGQNPRSIARDAQGRYWVTCMGSDELRVLNADGSLAHNLPLPYGSAPFGVAPSPDGQFLYVSLQGSARLRRYSAANPNGAPLETTTFPTPRALAVSGDGQRVLVTRFISPELEAEVGEFSGMDLAPVRTFRLSNANSVDGGDRAAGVPNYLAGIAISPDGTRATVVSKQDNVLRGTLFGVGNLTHETTVRAVLSVLDLQANVEIRHTRRDFDNSDSPTAVAYTPLGDTLLVTLQGNNRMVGLDAFNLEPLVGNIAQGATLTSPVVKTLEAATGLAPQGLLLDPVSERIFVQNFMGRSVTVLDAEPLLARNQASLPTVVTVATVGTELLSPAVLNGKRIFYNAADPRMSADSYISCASCHVDGGGDGRVWDFTGRGEGLRRTTDLRGRAGTGHGNVHWSGNFDEIQDFEHDIRGAFGGTGFLADTPTQFAANHASPASTKAGLSADLDALAAYVSSLGQATIPRSPFRAPNGSLTAAAEQGRITFLTLNCQQCHAGGAFTDSSLAPVGSTPLHNVGTLSQLSGQRLGQLLTGVDTPTLRGLHTARSYLHHGQAATLAEVFNYVGGTLHLAGQGQLLGTTNNVGVENENAAQGGGGYLRGLWGGSLVYAANDPGTGVRFGNVDGGTGGPARVGLRHILRSQGPTILRVNGIEQSIQLLPQLPENDWMTSGWRWVTADITLGAGTTNVIEVVRTEGPFTDFQLNAILVSHTNDLAATQPHQAVQSLSTGERTNLFLFLRSLDGADVSLSPSTWPTATLALAVGQASPITTPTVELDLTFSRAVQGLDLADFVVEGTAGGVAEALTPINPGLVYRLRVGGFVQNGSVSVTLPAGVVSAVDNDFPNFAANVVEMQYTPPVVVPAPLHRWSFNQPAGPAAAGTVLPDLESALPLEVRGLGAVFDGARLTIPGTTDSAQPDSTISAYLNLPNGVISSKTNLTVEIWAAPIEARNWGSLFEFGRMNIVGDGAGEPGEWTGITGAGPVNSSGSDLLALTTSRGSNLDQQRQVLMTGENFQSDILSDLSTTPGQTYHYVVTVAAQGAGSAVAWYRDGVLVGAGAAPFLLSALQDVNNWFGRSHWSALSTGNTAYDEIRIYDRVLTPAEIGASHGMGPDAVLGNQAPETGVDVVQRQAGRSLKIPVSALLANDSDADGPASLAITAVGPVSANGVEVTLQGGFVLYAAGAANTPDSFSYTVSDGDLTAQGTVMIQVEADPYGMTLNLIASATVGTERHFTAVGIPGRSYVLQRSDLVEGPWELVPGTAAAGAASGTGELQLRDAEPPPGPVTFYRVVEATAP